MRLQRPTLQVCLGHAWDMPGTCRLVPGKPGWAQPKGPQIPTSSLHGGCYRDANIIRERLGQLKPLALFNILQPDLQLS